MTFAAEDRLLLACSRSDPSDAALASVSDLTRGELDWGYLVETAVRHAMPPLLWRGLCLARSADPRTRVPDAVRDELAAMEAHNRRRNERLLRVAGDVVGALAHEGVPALALKDLQLVPEVYPDPALRPMGDVDLAVPRERYRESVRILGGLGFEPMPLGARPYTDRYAVGRQLRRAADETWLDLQWHVGEREWDRYGEGAWSFDTAGLWSRAVPFRLDGHDLLAPCPEDMLLHLCVHLEGHRYCELVLFADLVELLRHHGSDFRWDRFVELARSGRAVSAVFHALLLAERLVGLSLPAGRLEELRPPYFEAPLALPLFDNLTALHPALDDALAAGAPIALLDRLERLVRRQASQASRSFSAVDSLLQRLREEGSGEVAATALPSPRVLLDEGLPAFGDVEVLVEDDRLDEHLAAAAAGAGFRPGPLGWHYDGEAPSADPVLRDHPVRVRVDVITEANGRPRSSPAARPGLRRLAWKALTGPRTRAAEALRVRLLAVSRAELLASLLADAGRPGGHRLFDAAQALGVVETGAPAAGDVLTAGRALGAPAEVAVGLQILGALGARLGETAPGPPPRVLEWARYGPADLDTDGELRAAWFVAWIARQLGFVTGGRYLARGLRPGSPLVGALVGAARAGLGRLLGRRRTHGDAREHAYWLRPERSEGDPETVVAR